MNRIGTILVGALLALIIASSTLFVVDQRQFAVVYALGEIKEVILIDNLDLLIEKMGLNSTKTKKLSVLKAPMPGLVTGIKIAAGQEVEKGTPLIILEAMKMENMISAPHHAIIKSVNVSIGQAVDKGSVLVEFDV